METKGKPAASPAMTERVAFWAIAAFLVSGALFHGFLLEREYLMASAAGAILLLIMAVSGQFKLRQQALFWALVALAVSYGIAVLYAVTPGRAVHEALKSFIPLPIAVLGGFLSASAYRKLVCILLASASLTTILGLALGLFYEGRLAGLLDYANGLGILLFACAALGFPLYAVGRQWIYLPAAFLFALGIGLTQSRTVFALGVLGAFVSLLGSRKHDRAAWMNYATVSLMGVAGAVSYGNSVWVFAITVLLVGLLIWYLPRITGRKLTLAAAVGGAFALVFAVISLSSGHLFRWASLSSNLTDLRTRLVYYEDGLAMIRDSVLTGYGGGAWAEWQYRYQSADYYVAYLHNHALQTWLDAGLLGIGAFLAVAMLVAVNGIRAIKRSEDELRSFEIARLAACIALWLQSLLDFTFSSPYLFALFVFLGLRLKKDERQKGPATKASLGWGRFPLAACCAIIAMLAGTAMLSQLYYERAIRAAGEERLADAVAYLDRSMAAGIYDDAAHERKARLYYEGYMDRRDRAYLSVASTEINAALAVNPDQIWYRKLRSDIDWELGNREQALAELERLARDNPFRTNWLEELNAKRPPPD
ncbi:O-antigen ligase family protein [Paenibacillus methanolicus]|uniref:O-antigen ligase n=1 Tax=Paenibacillus methanolicus TaxID=582686 RepID=A0A5S5BWW0_9BACL|nr:O-antigen ligase family protein [Paenibacillus methanolicus]TYP70798.1 O-antigen ligase [Paenibacillus methanolicus]